ncbi:MAG: ABC transporter ATP-binding protein [Kiloniellales bacterium]|nr:ABC transporter ATP-binding protein [Kiloniellales bacterium]
MMKKDAATFGGDEANSGVCWMLDNAPIVKVNDVEKTYFTPNGVVKALGPISFSFRRGQTVAIVGPSGCGKSTMLKLLAGLVGITRGDISILSRPVAGPVEDIGVVFQKDLLLDWRSVIENVLLPAELKGRVNQDTRRRAKELLEELGVDGFENNKPWELSGGMRQRVAIARALLLKPSMLFLDEPFSALDALTRDKMNVIVQRLQVHEEVTTFFITHSIPEAVFLSDRVIVMSERPGRIIDDIEVSLPKPRTLSIREEPEFIEISRRIRIHFEKAGVL